MQKLETGVKLNLVSNKDIAKRLGVTTSTASNWPRRYSDFPAPVAVVGDGWTKVWLWDDVLAWATMKWEVGDSEKV